MYNFNLTESFIPAQTDDVIRDITVGGLLREVAAERGDTEALVEVTMTGELDRKWSYDELLAESERLALSLATRFKPGERITVWAPNIPEWVLIEYACALAGIVLVTANPAFQAKELRYVLEQSGSVGLFLVSEYRGNPMAQIAEKGVEGLTSLREVVDLEDAKALYHTGPRIATLPDVQPGDAAQIQYTSGTTGFPKGAILSHMGLINNAILFAKRAKINRDSVVINMMPMFHTSGCAAVTLGSLQASCKMLLVKLFSPPEVLKVIEQERVSFVLGVPTMLVALLETQAKEPRNVSSVEMTVSGGSMVAPDLVRQVKKVFGCDFETVYGQTETSPIITQHHFNDSLEDICNTVGQPLPQTAISIRSVAENKVVPVDTVGEICARGYLNMNGYHANEEATAATIDKEGWLHTGDLGAMDGRGYVRITGRVKEMMIRGGENLFPAEIENVLLEHPAVAEVAIVGLPDEKWGEIVGCFFRSEDNQEVDTKMLHAHCREHLAAVKTPEVWCQVDAFPLTGSGKIRRFALRDDYLAGKIA
ncbi:MAG: class I adenylate-forming enzyme family protein [Anaerolineae bacterium]